MSAPLSLLCENLISTLVARRHALGLSMYRLEKIAGINHSALSHWERGIESPTLPQLILWARALGMFVRFIPHAGRQRKGGKVEPHRGSQVYQVKRAA